VIPYGSELTLVWESYIVNLFNFNCTVDQELAVGVVDLVYSSDSDLRAGKCLSVLCMCVCLSVCLSVCLYVCTVDQELAFGVVDLVYSSDSDLRAG